MKNTLKRNLSVFLVVVMLLAIIPSGIVTTKAATLSQSQFDEKLSSAKSKYPTGSQKYEWSVNGSVVGWQCHGYGRWLSWYVWGVDFANGNGANWTLYKSTSSSTYVDKLVPGDVVRYRNSTAKKYNHTIFITAISGDTIYFTDCNSDGANTIKWNRSVSKSTLNSWLKISLYGSEAATYGYIAHYTLNTLGANPSCSCSTSYAGSYTCTTSSSPLTIRSGHGTSYSSAGSIPSGATVSVSKANGSWAHITYNGISGYASMEYLEKVCSHSYKTYYEAAHPHKVYKKCSNGSCGDWEYTGATKELSTCSSCWYATFSVSTSSLSLKVGETKTVNFSISGCLPDSRCIVYSRNTSLVESSATSNTITLKGIGPGKFNLKLYVYSDDTKSFLINSISIPVTVTTTEYTGKVSFDKSSISLVMPTKTSDTLKINLSGTWPDGAGYLFDYDKDIISLSQNGTELTITAKKAGTTDFAINIVNKNNNNTLITSASCDIYVNNATYNVKYDANGGTGAPSTQTKTHGENLTISSQKPEKKGYVFSCWTSNPDGSGTYAISGSTYTLNQDMLFYAYYKPIQYHIVFDKNGADGGTTSTSKHTYDKEQELPLNSLTKRGYTFLGWSEDPYATAPTYADGATVKNLSATEGSVVTLYAVWKEGHYGDVNNDGAITFDDCLLLNKAITESITVTPWIFVMGDVNGDGELTIVDTTLINKVRLGSSDSFPVDTMDKEINITTSAKKLQYFIGDTISIDGIGLSLHYPETGVSYDITSFCEFYLPGTDISGTKTVSVYFNGLRTKYSVTVTQPTITLSANTKTIIKGNTTTITATTNPSGQSVTWTSSNNNVATVSNGKITAKTTGSATITAKFTCNGIIYSKTCNVTVAEPAHTHTSGSWIVDEQVTCTANGSKHKECIDCGDILETQTIVATGHVLGDWIVDNQATVYKPGTKHRDCLLCMMYLEEAEIPQLKCAKPVLKKVYNANSYVKVTWDVVEGADKYRVYRKTGTGDYEYIGSTSNTYFNDKEAGAGKTCRYRIKAKNEAGYSEYSESLALKHVDEPTLKSIENSAYGVLIKWDKVTGAEKYSVYRKVSGGEYKYIGATSNTYYTDKTAKSGTKYYYAIRAKKGETVSALSNTKSIYHLADPTLNTPTSTTSGIKLSWSKVTGAEGYMVYRKTGSGSYSKIATVKGSTIVTYTDKSAKKGKKYTYKIKAYKSKTYSAYSNTKTITDTY